MANQSIKRAARILKFFSYARPRCISGDLAKAADLPVSTVHGILQSLEEDGILLKDPESKE